MLKLRTLLWRPDSTKPASGKLGAVQFRGAGLEIVWPELAVLAGLGSLFLAAALARFRTMLAKSNQ